MEYNLVLEGGSMDQLHLYAITIIIGLVGYFLRGVSHDLKTLTHDYNTQVSQLPFLYVQKQDHENALMLIRQEEEKRMDRIETMLNRIFDRLENTVTKRDAEPFITKKIMMGQFSASQDSINSAREYQNPNAQWIRRFLVVSFMSMAMFILLAPLLGFPTVVPVDVTSGFKILFFDFSNTVTEWVSLEGVVTPVWLPHAIMAVVGMYFGQSIASRK